MFSLFLCLENPAFQMRPKMLTSNGITQISLDYRLKKRKENTPYLFFLKKKEQEHCRCQPATASMRLLRPSRTYPGAPLLQTCSMPPSATRELTSFHTTYPPLSTTLTYSHTPNTPNTPSTIHLHRQQILLSFLTSRRQHQYARRS